MKIYKKLIKPMMLVPASANDYSLKKVPIELEEKWYPEESLEALTKKYKHFETTFETLGFEATYVEVDFDLLKEQEAKPVVVTTNAYGTKFYHCPKCNRDLYAYPRQRYCSQCGQEVKWE